MSKSFLFCCLVFISVASCKKQTVPAVETRSFYMGVTPWPADFTLAEVEKSYRFINSHCDLASHHFDDGIPYEEAYNNSNWPTALLDDLNWRKNQTQPGRKILLSVSALSTTRKDKAPYSTHSSSVSTAIKAQWSQLAFNDPKMVTAYTNFMKMLVDSLHPDYINYGVESNVETWDATAFIGYKDFIRQVYDNLKTAYPATPIMLSLIVNESPVALIYASQLLPYTDYLALSAYPYTHVSSSANGNTNPSLFPDEYFNRFINLAPAKPLCFAETGYIAEPLIVPAFNLNKQGNPQWQEAYLQKVCGLLNDKKGKFLVWFCHKDYDAAVVRLQASGQYQDLFGLWTNTGLVDENDMTRPAYISWLNWMNRPLE